jgi:putative ABC transport system ATP-binding protein
VNKPAVLLADEPTGNMDSKSEQDLIRLIGRVHAEGVTVVLITHNPEVAAGAGRIIRLKDGMIAGVPP